MPLDILLKTLNKLANKYSFSSLRAFGAGSTDMSVDEALNFMYLDFILKDKRQHLLQHPTKPVEL